MSGHTPGPWVYQACRVGYSVGVFRPPYVVVATSDEVGRFGTIANEADARLIAAAPELLEALFDAQTALALAGACLPDPHSREQAAAIADKARAAIAKATQP